MVIPCPNTRERAGRSSAIVCSKAYRVSMSTKVEPVCGRDPAEREGARTRNPDPELVEGAVRREAEGSNRSWLSSDGGIEIVVRCVGRLHLLATGRFVAVGNIRSLASLGVDSLNGGYPADDAVPGVSGRVHEHPTDVGRVTRICFCGHCAGHLASVIVLPGRAV